MRFGNITCVPADRSALQNRYEILVYTGTLGREHPSCRPANRKVDVPVSGRTADLAAEITHVCVGYLVGKRLFSIINQCLHGLTILG